MASNRPNHLGHTSYINDDGWKVIDCKDTNIRPDGTKLFEEGMTPQEMTQRLQEIANSSPHIKISIA